MEKVRNSSLIKIICYILIPILLFIFIVSIFDVILTTEYGETNQNPSKAYIETENFGNNYIASIYSNVSYITQKKKNGTSLLRKIYTNRRKWFIK